MDAISEIIDGIKQKNPRAIGRAISLVENGDVKAAELMSGLHISSSNYLVLGLTGPPGAGKSTLTDALISYFRENGKRVGIIAVDPSSPLTGGAFLGDRVRMMRHATDTDVVMRSMATRGRLGGVCGAAGAAVRIMASSGCEIILIETVGVGQSEVDVVRLADLTVMVLAPGLGDDIQAMKAGILEVADFIAVNKFDLPGADSLMMEMEEVFRDRNELVDPEIVRVHATIAPDGKGIDGLVCAVKSMEKMHCQSGEKDRKRHNNYNREVLDWSLEIIKDKLAIEIAQRDYSVSGDPRLQAEQIVGKIWS